MSNSVPMLMLKPSLDEISRIRHDSAKNQFHKPAASFRIEDLLKNEKLKSQNMAIDRDFIFSPTPSLSPTNSVSPPGNRGPGYRIGADMFPMSSHANHPLLPPSYPFNPFLKFGLNMMAPQNNYLINRGLMSLYSPHPFSMPNYNQLPFFLRDRLLQLSDAASGSRKCRRSRTVFSELQLIALEKRFERQKYLSTPDRLELADALGLTQLQVKTWYQNRRMKWKKQVQQSDSSAESDHDLTMTYRSNADLDDDVTAASSSRRLQKHSADERREEKSAEEISRSKSGNMKESREEMKRDNKIFSNRPLHLKSFIKLPN